MEATIRKEWATDRDEHQPNYRINDPDEFNRAVLIARRIFDVGGSNRDAAEASGLGANTIESIKFGRLKYKRRPKRLREKDREEKWLEEFRREVERRRRVFWRKWYNFDPEIMLFIARWREPGVDA